MLPIQLKAYRKHVSVDDFENHTPKQKIDPGFMMAVLSSCTRGDLKIPVHHVLKSMIA